MFINTYDVQTNNGVRQVSIQFSSVQAEEWSQSDYYDNCRQPIQHWLDSHFPGDVLNDSGEDIEASGRASDDLADVIVISN